MDNMVRERLRVRAAQHGRSMEEDILAIPTDAVREPSNFTRLAKALPARFEALGGIDLDLQNRCEAPRSVSSCK
ncbi:MAG: FitA-like ribbon-helix-helix domain-containing protein [Acidimicrobiales bacterium]